MKDPMALEYTSPRPLCGRSQRRPLRFGKNCNRLTNAHARKRLRPPQPPASRQALSRIGKNGRRLTNAHATQLLLLLEHPPLEPASLTSAGRPAEPRIPAVFTHDPGRLANLERARLKSLSQNYRSGPGRPGNHSTSQGSGTGSKNLSQNYQEKGPRPGNPVAPKGSGIGSKNPHAPVAPIRPAEVVALEKPTPVGQEPISPRQISRPLLRASRRGNDTAGCGRDSFWAVGKGARKMAGNASEGPSLFAGAFYFGLGCIITIVGSEIGCVGWPIMIIGLGCALSGLLQLVQWVRRLLGGAPPAAPQPTAMARPAVAPPWHSEASDPESLYSLAAPKRCPVCGTSTGGKGLGAVMGAAVAVTCDACGAHGCANCCHHHNAKGKASQAVGSYNFLVKIQTTYLNLDWRHNQCCSCGFEPGMLSKMLRM